jgi:predicted SprT family Zn-dependent metalloprotease
MTGTDVMLRNGAAGGQVVPAVSRLDRHSSSDDLPPLIEDVMHTTNDPTSEAYPELMVAHRYFNERLFGGDLPTCLFTLNRKPGSRGYFSAGRFENRNGEITDEIALNPDCFRQRSDRETLSTLVREMVHLWQSRFGKRQSRSSYHNQEWAEKMESLGLIPSDTGYPGGKRTGQRMTHYIQEGGPFDRLCAHLLNQGFKISWKSIATKKSGKSGRRVTYTCASCMATVWGKEGLAIHCDNCDRAMR